MSDDDKPLSMGCTVEPGRPLSDEHPRVPLRAALGTHGCVHRDGTFQPFSASFVSVPRCEECGEEMEVASSIHWKCPEATCAKYEEPVHVGVYPCSRVPRYSVRNRRRSHDR